MPRPYSALERRAAVAKVLDMPATRPHCHNCDKPASYFADVVESQQRLVAQGALDTYKRVVTVKRWTSWRGYPNGRRPLFCTLTCALAFAVKALEAGTRLIGGNGRTYGVER